MASVTLANLGLWPQPLFKNNSVVKNSCPRTPYFCVFGSCIPLQHPAGHLGACLSQVHHRGGMAAPTTLDHDDSAQRKLLHSSPLETLVRRTSSRRARNTTTPLSVSPSQSTHRSPPSTAISPPKPPYQTDVPLSPLLHSHFRSSYASASTNDNDVSSLMLRRSYLISADELQDNDHHYDDEDLYPDIPADNPHSVPPLAQPYRDNRRPADGLYSLRCV